MMSGGRSETTRKTRIERCCRSSWLLAFCVLMVACNRADSPTAAPAPKSAVSSPVASGPEPSERDASDRQADDGETLSAAREAAAAGDAAAVDASSEQQSPPLRARKLLVLAPGSPLLIELTVSVEGRDVRDAFEQLLDEAFAAADQDGDDRATWDELTAADAVRYGLYGSRPIRSEAERLQLVRTYDINQDRLVQRSELPRLLTQQAGGSRAFTLAETSAGDESSGLQSPLGRLLDQDGNRTLEEHELSAAPKRLKQYDADNDDVLYRVDFRDDGPRAMQMPGMARSTTDTAARAVLLDDVTPWESLLYWLEQRYAAFGRLQPDMFRWNESAYAALDADDNGHLDHRELKGIADLPAELHLAVAFRGDAAPHVECVLASSTLHQRANLLAHGDGRYVLALPHGQLIVEVRDPYQGVERILQQRAEALVKQRDQDGSGYLDAEEFPESDIELTQFEAVDADGDGQVDAKEIELFLRLRQAVARNRVQAVVADDPDALFLALDRDQDSRLATREIRGSASSLREFDVDADGRVTRRELPQAIRLTIARGDAAQAGFISSRTAEAETSDDAPNRWFAAMDLNQDGDLTRGEFLGSAEQFQQLDHDRDELLTMDEIGQVLGERAAR